MNLNTHMLLLQKRTFSGDANPGMIEASEQFKFWYLCLSPKGMKYKCIYYSFGIDPQSQKLLSMEHWCVLLKFVLSKKLRTTQSCIILWSIVAPIMENKESCFNRTSAQASVLVALVKNTFCLQQYKTFDQQ